MTLEEQVKEKMEASAKKVVVVEDKKPDPEQEAFQKRQKENEIIQLLKKDVRERLAKLPETFDRAHLPNLEDVPREAWLQGPEYVFGSILHRAKASMRQTMANKLRELEVTTAWKAGPLAEEISKEKVRVSTGLAAEIRKLSQEKVAKIEASRKAIAEEYNQKMAEAETKLNETHLNELKARQKQLTDQYEIDRQAALSLDATNLDALAVVLTPPPKVEKAPRFPKKMPTVAAVAAIVGAALAGSPEVEAPMTDSNPVSPPETPTDESQGV